jgi:ELWxxDGT repeat protein
MPRDTRDGSPGGFVTLPDGTVLFFADDGVHGHELWRTDGTAAGPSTVADLAPGPKGSDPRALTVVDGIAYLETGWAEYWRSDGTAAGTRRFLAVPGTAVGSTAGFAELGDEVVFGVAHGSEGFRFMATDGTAEGTRTLDVLSGMAPAPEHWHVAGGYLHFDFDRGLRRTDGTRAGTTLIEGARGVRGVAPGATEARQLAESAVGQVLDGRLYFGTVRGMETWAPGETATVVHDVAPRQRYGADGPGEMARIETFDLLVDIDRRTVGSDPSDAARGGDRVVFKTNEQQVLWATDGTYDGTVRLLERDGDGLPLNPFGLASDDTLALFAARDGIYRTDGTRAGTARVADIGAEPKSFTALARVGTTSVFAARTEGESPEASDLWRTDGTAAGTQRLTTGANLRYPTVALGGAGTMLVSGYTGGIWATDGTAAGSRRLFPEHRVAYVPEAIEVDDGFLASGGDASRGEELWHLDPQGGNPRLVKEFFPGVESSYPRVFGRTGNRMLFAIHTGGWFWRWQTMDLTTERVDPMTWLQGEALDPPVTAGGVTYLTTYSTYGVYLYRTDGTEPGTQLLRRFDGEFLDVPGGFTHFDGVTWFVAEDDEHGSELWRTDGTPEGTRLARDIVPGPESSYPLDLVATDDFLFFTADDDEHGPEPWRIRRTAKESPPAGEDPPVTISRLPLPEATPPPKSPRAQARQRAGAPVPVLGHHRHYVAVQRTLAPGPHGAVRGTCGREVQADSRRRLSASWRRR